METQICLLEPWMCTACADIAKTAPDPWHEADFDPLPMKEHHPCWVLLQNEEVVGFACFLSVAESADLQLVAIAPKHRQKGFAETLLCKSLKALSDKGIQQVFLEVRCSNHAAQALYQKLGFRVLARRKEMYRHPAEDGFLMSKVLVIEKESDLHDSFGH